MACNSCAKSFSILRPEKGCPGCGFSYCSKCLKNKTFLIKLNSEAKVCLKCLRSANSKKPTVIEPPKAYYERLQSATLSSQDGQSSKLPQDFNRSADVEIQERLRKLKEDKSKTDIPTEQDIAARLQKIKGEVPTCTDAELRDRLAVLKGLPQNVPSSKAVLITSDQRSEQEQANDLMRQYMEEAKINTKYKDEFDSLVNDIESRLKHLKQSETEVAGSVSFTPQQNTPDSEDEEERIRQIIEKAKSENSIEADDIAPSTNDELPFCEICNEDARMRCLGCRYLFCKRCFMEHKDDDDGCNRYEPYNPPKSS